jgi:ABC-2 type transport system permease protein
MMAWLETIFKSRFWALTRKEINQILRNKQLIVLLIFPPTVQLLVYGFALNPDVHNIKLGIIDYARSYESRELISSLTENKIFLAQKYLTREADLAEEVREGKVTAGLIIPPTLQRNLEQDKSTEIQVFIDGVDANQAGIASGYMSQIISQFNRQLVVNPTVPLIDTQTTFLYNPGLRSSWFFVPGVLGIVLTLISSLVSSITVVKEKDTGTLEQLLMTPAAAKLCRYLSCYWVMSY